MPPTADPIAAELHAITLRLRQMLDDLAMTLTPILTPQQIAELLSALLRAGECMRAIGAVPREEISGITSAYRTQVERLRVLLPSIHGALLREKARLAQGQERLRAVTAWTKASQQSF